MSIKLCPNCNQRYIVDNFITDFVHSCNSGNKAIDEEDIIIVGNWEDFSGSGNIPAQQVLMQGSHNELQGNIAQIKDNKDKEKLTRRGVRASTHRQRQRLTYINLSNEGLQ